MNKINKHIISCFIVLILVITSCISAFACVSEADDNLSDYERSQIQHYTNDYNKAKAEGNEEGMAAAHAQAESVRLSHGYYGGSDGSNYNPLGTSTRSNKSSSDGVTTIWSGFILYENWDPSYRRGKLSFDNIPVGWNDTFRTYIMGIPEGETHTITATIIKDNYRYTGFRLTNPYDEYGELSVTDVTVKDNKIVTLTATSENKGVVKMTFYASPITNITATANLGGTISPEGVTQVALWGNQTYNIMPDDGYRISDVKVDGVSMGALSSYTFSLVTGSHTIDATFQHDAYTITAAADTGGAISPIGATEVNFGKSQAYKITANKGYKISTLLIDGAVNDALLPILNDSNAVTTLDYTFSNVTKNHTIEPTFTAVPNTITAMASTGGSISPVGATKINFGESQAYTITANKGYKISDVIVDGTSVGALSSYTFRNIEEDHTINATFASNASLSTGNATLGDDGSGTLKSGVTKSGYGITASLPVTASYVNRTTVTASYNFISPETVSLEYVGGTWQFPVNNSSVTGARKIYIPVDTKDGRYTITFTVKALDPQATALTGSNVYLTSTKTTTITIDGCMYDDDFTGIGNG